MFLLFLAKRKTMVRHNVMNTRLKVWYLTRIISIFRQAIFSTFSRFHDELLFKKYFSGRCKLFKTYFRGRCKHPLRPLPEQRPVSVTGSDTQICLQEQPNAFLLCQNVICIRAHHMLDPSIKPTTSHRSPATCDGRRILVTAPILIGIFVSWSTTETTKWTGSILRCETQLLYEVPFVLETQKTKPLKPLKTASRFAVLYHNTRNLLFISFNDEVSAIIPKLDFARNSTYTENDVAGSATLRMMSRGALHWEGCRGERYTENDVAGSATLRMMSRGALHWAGGFSKIVRCIDLTKH